MTVSSPAWIASSASAWWMYGRSIPRAASPLDDARIQPVRELAEHRLARREHRVMDDAAGDGWLGQQVRQDGGGVRGSVESHGRSS